MKATLFAVALWGGAIWTAHAQSAICLNTDPLEIRDYNTANPYPSTILISNASWRVGRVTLTLSNLSHTAQSDVNVLLIGPEKQAVYLIAGPNGTMDFTRVTLTIDDTALAGIPAICPSGSYKPTGYNPEIHDAYPVFPSPAPAGPYSDHLSVFEGTDPNGAWSLFIIDDENGDSGKLEGGWSLHFEKVYPLVVRSSGGLLEVSWPAEANGYILISSSDLGGDNWTVVPNVPAMEGEKKMVRLQPGTSPRFFKLLKLQ
jgi:subtilisin-like proprotein convertase family protein